MDQQGNWAAYAELAAALGEWGKRVADLVESLIGEMRGWNRIHRREERKRLKAVQRSQRLRANPKTKRHGERAGVYRKRVTT